MNKYDDIDVQPPKLGYILRWVTVGIIIVLLGVYLGLQSRNIYRQGNCSLFNSLPLQLSLSRGKRGEKIEESFYENNLSVRSEENRQRIFVGIRNLR